MALATYYQRAALAASQVLSGFDAVSFHDVISRAQVGVSIGAGGATSPEGRALADLTVRLLARLYPSLELLGEAGAADDFVADLKQIAQRINPNIEFRSDATAGIAIGPDASSFAMCVYAGSRGWDAYISAGQPQPVGVSRNPLGAAAAACLAVGYLFNGLFLPSWAELVWADTRFSTYDLAKGATPSDVPNEGWMLPEGNVLVGAGAIGNAALWVLGRAPLDGTLHVVDPEPVELSNLQRYVLADYDDVGRPKAELARERCIDRLNVQPHALSWEQFAAQEGYAWTGALAALDSASARKAVQASLPRWVANAWTQPGDLGVSVHGRFASPAACLWCLYLPNGPTPNEDEIVANALGVPQHVTDIRTLLHTGQGVPRPLLEAIANGLGLPVGDVIGYEDRPVRELYVEGVCGGGLLPLGTTGMPRQELHVPLAHQSALAGVLLAAALARRCVAGETEETEVSRIDVLEQITDYVKQQARRRGDGTCICEDIDYVAVFTAKTAPV